jgi:hypothetical protein
MAADLALRRRVNAGLNKGEAKNALARAVFFNRLGELRDRSFENQRYRGAGNLAIAAMVAWNTVYLETRLSRVSAPGKEIGTNFTGSFVAPGWEHINLTEDYVWHSNKRFTQGRFRPLRAPTQQKFLVLAC